MAKRGRKSAAELAVVKESSVYEVERATPPADLTPEQKQEWVAVVNRLSADHFPRETHGVLAQYCRHVVASRRVSDLIQQMERMDPTDEGFAIEDYDRLLKMQEREGRALSSLATRMRLTQQSTYDAKKKKPSQVKKTWNTL